MLHKSFHRYLIVIFHYIINTLSMMEEHIQVMRIPCLHVIINLEHHYSRLAHPVTA